MVEEENAPTANGDAEEEALWAAELDKRYWGGRMRPGWRSIYKHMNPKHNKTNSKINMDMVSYIP